MPVRIYEIAKKLGVESKAVLALAKELGIAAARVASSTLDKITAEYLEQQLAATLPPPPPPPPPVPEPPPAPPEPAAPGPPEGEPAAPVAADPAAPVDVPPATGPAEEAPPAVVISVPAEPTTPVAPTDQPADIPPGVTAPGPIVEIQAPVPAVAPPTPLAEPAPAAVDQAPPPPAAPAVPPPPPVPPPPKIGDKVGFIKLPTRPARFGDKKAPPARPGAAPAAPSRPDFSRRQTGDTRFLAGQAPAGRPGMGPARAGQPGRPEQAAQRFVAPTTGELIMLKPPVIVRDLAERLRRKPFQLIADLMELKVMANVNQTIDETTAQRLCAKYGFRFEVEKRERGGGVHAPARVVEKDPEDKTEDLKPRAPVVTIMGHVDHGKTSLLDVIRTANVAAGEAGGITQHIGAYTISVPHPDRKNELAQITFLDTPGHAAFSAMRARGANVTDIVVLVVAADDGVMPQTLEALSHAQAARCPIIVAINKCDLPGSNPLKVRQQLQDKGLVPDDWGGDTPFVEVSAVTKTGVPQLLEMILLRADLMELKANPTRLAKGNVVESGLEPGGPTATVLVRKGTLRVGNIVLCGPFWGKVRALINEENNRLKEAGPSVAVKMLGLNGVPEAGLEFGAVENDKAARDMAETRQQEARIAGAESRSKVTIENLFKTMADAQSKILKVVVKADAQGSVEAIVDALKKVESDKVSLEVVHSAVGTINESDVQLANASRAVILGFHSRVDGSAADLAKREGVQIKLYTIIYELIDEVKLAMAGLLDPILKENVIGSAEVKKIFELSKGGNVAGCMVSSGRLIKGRCRVVRRKSVIKEGIIQTLRRFQDEVTEVRAGMECGLRVDGFNDFAVGDLVECYLIERLTPKL